MRQAMAQNEKRPAGFLFGNQTLNLRQNIGLPRRHVFDFLTVLVFDVRNPHAVEIRRLGASMGRSECYNRRDQHTQCRGLFH